MHLVRERARVSARGKCACGGVFCMAAGVRVQYKSGNTLWSASGASAIKTSRRYASLCVACAGPCCRESGRSPAAARAGARPDEHAQGQKDTYNRRGSTSSWITGRKATLCSRGAIMERADKPNGEDRKDAVASRLEKAVLGYTQLSPVGVLIRVSSMQFA